MKSEKPAIEIVAWIPVTPLVVVRGQSGNPYTVNHNLETCTCPDFKHRAKHRCKHIMEILSLLPYRDILEFAQAKRFALENARVAAGLETDEIPF